MSAEDLALMIRAAELIVAGVPLHDPVEAQIKALAIAVLTLRDCLNDEPPAPATEPVPPKPLRTLAIVRSA